MYRANILMFLLSCSYMYASDKTSLSNSSILQKSHYGILNVPPQVGESSIKKAYRRLAVKLHPDKDPTNPKAKSNFQRLGKAYENLYDPEKRQPYDQYLAEQLCLSTDDLERQLGENFNKLSKNDNLTTCMKKYTVSYICLLSVIAR